MANRKYTPEEKKAALKKFDQAQSATKTVRALGYPGRWTLHKWLRERNTTKPKPFRHEKLTHYPFATKLASAKMYEEGYSPQFIAEKFDLRSKMSVYSWAQTYRDKGEWALMTKRERETRAGFPTRASLEASFPDDVDELKRQLAKLTVEKALVDKELELVKKDDSVVPGELSHRHKTQVIDALRSFLPLPMLLDASGLAHSSFYYQLQASRRPDKYAQLRVRVAEHARRSRFTYGYRRLKYSLARDGVVVSEKVIRRIIKEDGIVVRYKPTKARYSSYKGEIAPATPDLVKRNFHADYAGRLWLTDVTEMAGDDGKVYLSALIDCFDSKVVGWSVGFNPNQELVDASLRHALTTNPPDDPSRLVIYPDRGCQYRSRNLCDAATTVGFRKSMSRRGCSPDNAACEAFFGRMKVEMFHDYRWHRKADLAEAVEDYLKFYNTGRITNTLCGLTIEQHRRMMTA